ncbi:MAG: hypothetical protein WC071_07415 [Victivallaceae bacterium]
MKYAIKRFTLIEVVVALGIMLVIAAMIGLVLTTSYRAWERVNRMDALFRQKQNIDRIVNTAFKNAIPFSWKNDNLKEELVFKGESSMLLLAYLHRIGASDRSGIRFVQLRLEDNKLIAEYRDTPILPWREPASSEVTKEVIVSQVKEISFLYADILPENNSVQLMDSWDNKKTYIPRGIQITIEFEDGSKESWFRRTAASGYMQFLGKKPQNVIR